MVEICPAKFRTARVRNRARSNIGVFTRINVLFDPAFRSLIHFSAAWQKYFKAVVLVRIVRSTNDDAGVKFEPTGEIGDTRCGYDPGRFGNSTLAAGTGVKSRFDSSARFAS